MTRSGHFRCRCGRRYGRRWGRCVRATHTSSGWATVQSWRKETISLVPFLFDIMKSPGAATPTVRLKGQPLAGHNQFFILGAVVTRLFPFLGQKTNWSKAVTNCRFLGRSKESENSIIEIYQNCFLVAIVAKRRMPTWKYQFKGNMLCSRLRFQVFCFFNPKYLRLFCPRAKVLEIVC